MSESREVLLNESEELDRYATVVRFGSLIALGVIVIAFILDMTGLVPPAVPHEVVMANWGKSHEAYAAATGRPIGWASLVGVAHADVATMAGIVMLLLLSITALASVLPIAVRKRDWLFGTMAVVQILVILLAAAGVLAGGR